MQKWRPPKRFLKDTGEITGGLLAANLGDIVNITIMAIFLVFFKNHPEALAVLPGLANMRGSIYTSLASRVSTNLHLGIYEAKYSNVARNEWSHGITLSFTNSLIVGFLAGLFSGISIPLTIAISITSTAISWIVMMPGTVFLSVLFFKKGVDPDRVSAPVITVLGDGITIPSLAAATIGAIWIVMHPLILTLLISSTLTLVTVVLTINKKSRSIFIQTMSSLLIVSIIESITGAILARWSARILEKKGLMPLYPSFLEDVGAVAAVVAAKTSTMAYLGTAGKKSYEFTVEELILLLQAHIAMFPTMIILPIINKAYSTTPLLSMTATLFTGGLIVAIIGSILSSILVKATYEKEVDPDNTILPLTTGITDLAGTIILPIIALAII
ncbi:MAG: magnesium transporter [Desulfurococcales archaeon]|nr:magnesium transporter [Desulfurococcales archaeon]